jgi:histidinol-phosphate aminotransferase
MRSNAMMKRTTPRPVARLAGETGYDPVRSACPTDLKLDGNEGPEPSPDCLERLVAAGTETLRRYPDSRGLEALLAARLGVEAPRVLVTAGADEALDRICRAYLDGSRTLVTAVPTFEMIPRYARLAGADVLATSWPAGDFPVDEVLGLVDDRTGVIAVVTPNNPTGAVATVNDLTRLAEAAPGALLLVDLAYGEFADEDLMPAVLELPNALAVRSLSKAWGLAGLRVGYVAGARELVAPLRAAGGPYAVAGPSLLAVTAALEDGGRVEEFVAVIRREREVLRADLTRLGADPIPSQGNFVYAAFTNPAWVRDGLAGLGIAVRLFEERPGPGPLRISCPGNETDFRRLRDGLQAVMAPEALLFDMDGVLADVSRSYRRAILETARAFGETFTPEEVAAAKRQPGSNNDWVLTQNLLAGRGRRVDLAEVTARFQEIYQDLAAEERLIPDRDLLVRLAGRLPLAIVTGRPREDAEVFLGRAGIGDLFAAVVCLEDGPGKPDPATVNLALEKLGVRSAWMVGDTVNDIGAARAADVLPLGVVPPGENSSDYASFLIASGAGRVLNNLSELEEVLPR